MSKLLPAMDVPTVVPQYPIIEVKKRMPVDEELAAPPGRQESARMIGQAIAETLAPLVNSNAQESKRRNHLPVDHHTEATLAHLANQFEEEGV